MIERQIDGPIPGPPGLVVQKASKARSRFAESSPGPQSLTVTTISSRSVLLVRINSSRDSTPTQLRACTALLIKLS
jgi:hypothetical protein